MKKNDLTNILILLVIGYILLSANIRGLYIYALDEAKNSECAREMLESGDFIVPTFNQELRTDKPPLHYYFMIASYAVFGVNEFSARFFSVVFGVLTVLITYLFARRFAGQSVAILTSIIFLSSLHVSIQFHMAVPDPYLIFFMTASFMAFYTFLKTGNKAYLWIIYISLALGSLTKGPVAVVLPGLTFVTYLVITGKFNGVTIKSFRPGWGILLFLAIALPWYLAVHYKTGGEWTSQFFLKHNLNRYTDTMEGHGAIFLVTPLMVIVGMLPFSVFVIQAFKFSWQNRKSNEMYLYVAITVLVITIFFSLSKTKLPNYTVPAYPLFAIMLGGFLNTAIKVDENVKGNRISLGVYTLIALLLPLALYFILMRDKYFNHLTGQSWWFIMISAGAVAGVIIYYYHDNRRLGMITIAISWMIIIMIFFHWIYPKFDKENPVAKSVGLIDRTQPIRGYNLFNPSYVFYLRQEVPKLLTLEELQEFCRDNPGGQIITRTQYENDYMQIENLEEVTRHKDIFEIPTSIILRVKD